MMVLVLFAFLAGIVTVLSPCILPLLPVILAATDTSGRQRPLGVIVGFIASFTFFTLFLSTLVRVSGISADLLRFVSIIFLAGFGISLVIPWFQLQVEVLLSKLARFVPNQSHRTGFNGGILIGLSLGLLWTPCVGPILASVISLALTGTVTTQAVFITLAYALGTAIPMFGILTASATALKKLPWLVRHTAFIQRSFGILMIATAVGLYFNIDRQFQATVLRVFPQYGTGLTKLETNTLVTERLPAIKQTVTTAPEIIPGGEWFNSAPIQLSQLRGKVVLIDFWTYTCINCQRTLPYLKNWWAKYQNDNFVIIGVHAPEFEFEKNASNVKKAISDFGLTYPIVQDNDFATWTAYQNQFWPAKYLIDKDGVIRYTHFGEGNYDETEAMIQQLLKETGTEVTQIPIQNPENKIYARTPETYLGYNRLQYIATPSQVKEDRVTSYTFPERLPNNEFALQGQWQITQETANPFVGAQLKLNFESKAVYLVMKPKNKPGTVRVFVDEVLHQEISVSADQLYTLVDLPNPGKHTLRLEFNDSNLELFAFTFG